MLKKRSNLAATFALTLLLGFMSVTSASQATASSGTSDIDGAFREGTAELTVHLTPHAEEGTAFDSGDQAATVPEGFYRCQLTGEILPLRIWWKCPLAVGDTMTVTQPTISDLASFKPQTPTIAGEPDGWALKGRAANFIAPVDAHVVAGTLLGRPADVRFTPVTWHWNFGDGSTATSSSGGDTWGHLGLPRFSTTPTSHVYRERSRYTVSLGIEYRADYRYDGGDWNPIEGTLTVPVGSEPVRVFVGSTVLTARGCDGRDAASC